MLICFLLSSGLLLAKEIPKNTKSLHFLSTDYCPLICENKKDAGIMIDILKAIFEPEGYSIKVSFEPIKRAFVEINTGKFDGFVGGNKEQLKENLFPKYITTPNRLLFFKRKGLDWNFDGQKSLEEITFIIVKGFNYANNDVDSFLERNINSKRIIVIPNGEHIKKMTQLVLKGRGDAFIAGELPTQYRLRDSLSKDQLDLDSKIVGVFKNYISIHSKAKSAKHLLSILNKRFKILFDNGTIQKIYKKYGITRKITLTK
jgi:polar amino acid transport system substrate-binding protein